MPAFAYPDHLGTRADLDLQDARDSLAYWEARTRQLPRHALRRRREAREMVVRWQARVAEAERAAYGRGLLGAMLQVIAERRLPQPARRAARTVARRTAQVTMLVLAALTTLIVAGMVAVVALLTAIF